MSEAKIPTEKVSTRKQVQELLMAEDRFSLAGSLGMLLWGLAACLLMAIVVASLITFILYQLLETSYIGWFGWFAVFWVVLIPLLIWHERKGKKDYVVAALNSEDPEPSSVGEMATDRLRVNAAVGAQILTYGPRQVLEGFAGVRGHRKSDRNAVFKRAAQILLTLAKEPGGIGLKALMRPPENMPVFMAGLDWLDKHDYIGRSSDGERIWIGTLGRKKLADHGITPKISMGL